MGGIKANELRIGNWVQLENYTKYQIEPHHFQLNWDGYSTVLDLTISIPLTEEILLKCGFEKSKSYNNYKVKAGDYFNSVQHYDGEWIYSIDESDAFCYTISAKIDFLHQLQNLYFALTNEELNIQL